MSGIGIIAIGRNEGERLRRCLESVTATGATVVYVDSGSTDGSVALAQSLGAIAVKLDASVPFSAARARNAGVEALLQLRSDVRFLQFVDGDCEVAADWIACAEAALDTRPDVAVVCGRRRERFPERSVYNRMADLEWNTPVGETRSCGGDAIVRIEAFQEVGGFNASVAAGEEPELCQRLREHGWKVLRIDAEMTIHDSAMLHFSQWWRRSVRGGYGAMDVASRFGSQGLFVSQVRSARLWTLAWPAAFVLTGVTVGSIAGIRWGMIAGAVIALALPAQVIRLAIRVRGRTARFSDALACGILTMIGKWASMVGQFRYRRDRLAGRNTRLIEYKEPRAAKRATIA